MEREEYIKGILNKIDLYSSDEVSLMKWFLNLFSDTTLAKMYWEIDEVKELLGDEKDD